MRALARLPALALILLAQVLVACGGPPEHVRIGLITPLSGPRASLGREVRDGAVRAVEDLNAAGGLLGHPVELLVRDDTDLVDIPGQLASLAERARVTAVVGPEAPGVLLGPRNPLTRREVPAVLPTAFAGDLSRAGSTVVRTVPSAEDQALTLGAWFAQVRGIRRVALLVADPVEGRAARQSVADGLTRGGVELAAVVEADGTAPDLGPSLAALRQASGDAGGVILWGPPDVAARATRAARDQPDGWGWRVQLAVPSSAFVGEYRTLAGEASEGVVLPFPFREEWFGTEMEDWMVRWHREHGLSTLPDLDTLVLDLPVAALAAYDAVGLVGAAVRQAGTREPRAVSQALRATDYPGLLQRYAPGEAGEAWSAQDLFVARFHHFAVLFDVDLRQDPQRQRRFYDFQVRLEYIPQGALEGPAAQLLTPLLERQRAKAPPYTPPAPPPGPVTPGPLVPGPPGRHRA